MTAKAPQPAPDPSTKPAPPPAPPRPGYDACPKCGRETEQYAGKATYSCTVPGCLKMRFCCPACILHHMGEHVRDRDELLLKALPLLQHFGFCAICERQDGTEHECYADDCNTLHDEIAIEHKINRRIRGG